MSDAREPLDSRRDFFKSLSNRNTLRSLGGLMGSVVGIVTKLTHEDSCESAGLALGQGQEPFDYTYHAPPGSDSATDGDCLETTFEGNTRELAEGGEKQD